MDETLKNRALLLYLIDKAHEKTSFVGITKLQKLAFLSQLKANKDCVGSTSFEFYRWNFGPMSNEVYRESQQLQKSNLLLVGDNMILSQIGKEVLNNLQGLFSKNKEILQYINAIASDYAKYRTEDLTNLVYKIKIKPDELPNEMPIGDIPKGYTLLHGLESPEKGFKLSPSWEATLEVLFDRDAYNSLKEGMEDVRAGRVTKR
jgi:uncharacterized phage-associated protein